MPAPLEVKLEDSVEQDFSGRALVTIVGIRRASRRDRVPCQFEVSMRFENLGKVPFRVEPESLELVTADLESIGGARLAKDSVTEIEPGASTQLDVAFPLPAGRNLRDYDLSGLNLRWSLLFADRRQTVGASFQRYLPARYYYDYYDPFWYPWGWHGHVGVRVGHFHRY